MMYLDTADLEEIREGLLTGIFKGVTTNPTILLKEKGKRSDQVRDILHLGVDRLFIQLIGDSADTLYEDYKKVKALNKEGKLAYKVALNLDGLKVVRKILEDDKDAFILGTAIYSADQAILGAAAGCRALAPYVNRMEDVGVDALDAIFKARQFIDERGLSCEIIAASFKNTRQIVNALTSGAHTVTIPYDLFLKMAGRESAQAAIRVFNRHGEELEE